MSSLKAVHLAVALFGAAGLFARWIPLPPAVLVLGRVVFASAALAGALAFVRRTGAGDRPPPSSRGGDRVGLAALGGLLALHWVTFFHAIQLSSVAVGLLTFATFPVFTALLEPLLPDEAFDGGSLVAAAVTVVGVGLVVPVPDPGNPVARGAFWGVISGLTFAVLSLVNRRWVRRRSALSLALHQDAWAAVFLVPFAVRTGALPSPREWALLALLGIVFTACAHGLFIHGLKEVRARTAAVIAALEPVYGVALAALLLGERPTPRTLVGGALVLAAATWVSLRRDPAPRSG